MNMYEQQISNLVKKLKVKDGDIYLDHNRIPHSLEKPEWNRECQSLLYTHGYACGLTYDSVETADQENSLVPNYDWVENYLKRSASMEAGWTVERSSPNHDIRVRRHNVSTITKPGYYIYHRDDRSNVKIPNPKVREQASDIFVYLLGNEDQNIEDGEKCRVYFNSDPDTVVELLDRVQQILNRGNIPFISKFIKYSNLYINRKDSLVLYIPKYCINRAMVLIKEHYPALRVYLNASLPLFLYEVFPGVGFGESPPNPLDSFGSSRCRVLATILYDLVSNEISRSKWANEIIIQLQQYQFDLKRLYLNPGSGYYYHFIENKYV